MNDIRNRACLSHSATSLLLALIAITVAMVGCSNVSTSKSSSQTSKTSNNQPKTFDELVAKATRVASNSREVHNGSPLTVRVEGTDEQSKTITFAIDDQGSTSNATVTWSFRDGFWRVTSMTSSWSEFGLLSLMVEQDLINKVCWQLDDQYTPPRSDPEKSAETLDLINEFMNPDK